MRRVVTTVAGCLTAALLATSCDGGAPASTPGPASAPASGSVAPSDGPARRRPASVGATATVRPAPPADPRWRFFTRDRTRYSSPWFAGRHRVMIGYGCTSAPYYPPDPRCDGQGFHHGVDVALPCGTPLRSGAPGRVLLAPSATVGPAYGERPLLLRITAEGRPADVLLGHARELLVRPGDQVHVGDRIALAGASGAPDGCHLHLEVRAAGGDVTSARHPATVLRLR